MKTSWYVATLVVQCIVEGQTSGPWTFDEQVRVLRAVDDVSAYEKALQLGKAEEHSYDNADGQNVTWKFVGLSDLEYLSDASIRDGTEIRSRLFSSKVPLERVQVRDQLTVFRWAIDRQNRQKSKTPSPRRQPQPN